MSISARFRFKLDDFRLEVDLELPERGVTSLFGPSGFGKTSLLRAIACLDRHDGGYLQVGDLQDTFQHSQGLGIEQGLVLGLLQQGDQVLAVAGFTYHTGEQAFQPARGKLARATSVVVHVVSSSE